MFESKNLLDNALQDAIYDRLCSAVYYALNTGLDPDLPDPDDLYEHWSELDAGGLAHLLVRSLSPDGAIMANAVRVEPWLARYLRPYDEAAFFHIIERWLAKEPLADHICENPQDENLKVKRLEKLISAIHDAAKPTVGKIIP